MHVLFGEIIKLPTRSCRKISFPQNFPFHLNFLGGLKGTFLGGLSSNQSCLCKPCCFILFTLWTRASIALSPLFIYLSRNLKMWRISSHFPNPTSFTFTLAHRFRIEMLHNISMNTIHGACIHILTVVCWRYIFNWVDL